MIYPSHCFFCGKAQCAGPNFVVDIPRRVGICRDCVWLCVELMNLVGAEPIAVGPRSNPLAEPRQVVEIIEIGESFKEE